MANFLRHRHPDFWLPGRKPIGPVVLDRSHPLVQGLALAFLLNERSTFCREYVSGRNGAITGAPTVNVTARGLCTNIVPVNANPANYITVANAADIQGFSKFTVAYWYKWDGTLQGNPVNSPDWMTPVSKGDYNGNEWCPIMNVGSGGSSGAVWFAVNGSSSTVSATISFDTNWHHWAFTCDGSTGKIFYDGVQKASAGVTPTSTTADFQIGRDKSVNFQSRGDIDALCYAHRAWSNDEIVRHMLAAYEMYQPANTRAWAIQAAAGGGGFFSRYYYDQISGGMAA